LFAEFLIYSKHKPASAPRFPFVIRFDFLGSPSSQCRKRRHPTRQRPKAGVVELGVGRHDIACDPTRENSSKRLSIHVLRVA
jgi:hypothetical protein